MRVAKAFEERSQQADVVVRPVSAGDQPVASPVHSLQRSLDQSVAAVAAPGFQADVALIRIGMLFVVPALIWTGIIRLAMSF